VDKQQQLEGMCGIESSELKRKFQAALPGSQINDSKVPATSAMKVCLKLPKSQTGGKGTVKTCTMIKNEKELNKNIGSKSLHHFIHRLLKPSARQQVTIHRS